MPAVRALFISFFYPPFNSIGGLRVSKMTRYLRDLGWDVRVVTAAEDDLPADLGLEIPVGNVIRVDYLDVNALPKRILGRGRVRSRGFETDKGSAVLGTLGRAYRDVVNFPDGQIGWFRPALTAARALVEEWRPDVLVSSALPATAHLVANRLAKQYAIPWVAEYRDPWCMPGRRRRSWPLSLLERKLEDRVLRGASAIVTVSDAWAQMYRGRFRGVPVYTVPNGFDSSDLEQAKPPEGPPLRILYSGRVYERQNPMLLLRAVRALVDGAPLVARTIRLEFVGRYLGSVRRAVSSLGLDSVVVVSEPLSHRAALAAQQAAHVLVLLLGMDDDVGWRPAKLYEYLGARRPILVIGGTAQHEAWVVLRECRAGVAVDTVENAAAQLQAWALELQRDGTIRSSVDEVCRARYERRSLAGELSDALKATVQRQTRT